MYFKYTSSKKINHKTRILKIVSDYLSAIWVSDATAKWLTSTQFKQQPQNPNDTYKAVGIQQLI